MNQFKSLFALVLFVSATAIVSFNPAEKKVESQPLAASLVSPIEGAWELISPDGKITQFKMFHNGFFSYHAGFFRQMVYLGSRKFFS